MYFWIIKVLCLILYPAAAFPLPFFDGDCFLGYGFSSSNPSSLPPSGDPSSISPPHAFFLGATLTSSSLPWQYSRISLCRVSRSLKTWIPRPRFKCVGFSSHKLNPSKWHCGMLYLVVVRLSKLKVLNFVTPLPPTCVVAVTFIASTAFDLLFNKDKNSLSLLACSSLPGRTPPFLLYSWICYLIKLTRSRFSSRAE